LDNQVFHIIDEVQEILSFGQCAFGWHVWSLLILTFKSLYHC